MHIGQLARQAGVTPDTIRYYEREGILPSPARLESRYRSYGQHDVARLRFIQRAKALGFTLADISELLNLFGDTTSDMSQVRRAAQARLAGIEAKLVELTRLRDGLVSLVEACPGHGELQVCPILNALAGETHEHA
jgi:MerR family copper efflux transcriptional regulator